jgi:hypothetical protein
MRDLLSEQMAKPSTFSASVHGSRQCHDAPRYLDVRSRGARSRRCRSSKSPRNGSLRPGPQHGGLLSGEGRGCETVGIGAPLPVIGGWGRTLAIDEALQQLLPVGRHLETLPDVHCELQRVAFPGAVRPTTSDARLVTNI